MRWVSFAAISLLCVACSREGVAPPPAAPLPAQLRARLAWATYWGLPGGSALRSAVFDAAGNLYIAGGTLRAAEWPRTAPAIGPLGGFDVIVAKFDRDGRNLWSLVIGGSGEDYAYVSTLDAEGNLIVGGRSGPDFPVTPGAYDTSFAGGFGKGPHEPTDGFLLSLTPDGALRWATYLGSAGDDVVRGIERLADGAIAVSGGNTDADGLTTTPGVLKPKRGGAKDAFVGVIEADGARARFITHYGPSDDRGQGDETIRAIGQDPRGNLWIGGTTSGTDLHPTPDAFQATRGGGGDAFVAKLAPDGASALYFSWLGGSAGDDIETEGFASADGAFFVAGGTRSRDFPVTPGAIARGGLADGFVARVDPDGRLGMAARFGGSGRDHLFGPARDAAGNLYVSGTTESRDLPVTSGALQRGFAGGTNDALFAAFDRSGALAYATYFGGSGNENGRFAAADLGRRRIALIGETTSTDLPLRAPAQTKPGAVYVALFEVEGSAAPAHPASAE